MNKTLIFLIISTLVLIFSTIVICVAPIINKIQLTTQPNWKTSEWGNLNCRLLADKENDDNERFDEIEKIKKYKNLCYRQKAMYGLEYSAFIINAILSFLCADLTLLFYLNIGKDFQKKIGLFGIISGVIGFILTLVYVSFSGYIFNNDFAYGYLNLNVGTIFNTPNNLFKLYPNGAKYKLEGTNNYITINQNDKEENSHLLKYKDLGEKQYNYDGSYFETYYSYTSTPNFVASDWGTSNIILCNIINQFVTIIATDKTTKNSDGTDGQCDYLYDFPKTTNENKYIYDRWLTALVLSVLIVALNLIQIVFGFLLFKNNGETALLSDQTPVIYNK